MDSPHLPEELVILVLEKLPPKYCVRFKCVCKSWLRIISSPSVLLGSKMRDMSLAITETTGLSCSILESPASSVPTEFTLRTQLPNTWCIPMVAGTCRGIACLADSWTGSCVLWNPKIGESRALPEHDHYRSEKRPYIGFGHYNNDFKVVKISKNWRRSNEPIHVLIYELSLDSWREIINPIGIDSHQFKESYCTDGELTCWRDGRMCSWIVSHGKGGYENRTRDWMCSCIVSHGKGGYENRTRKCIIVSFDMANESFTTLPSVPIPNCSYYETLLTLNDFLAFMAMDSHPGNERSMDIWVLLESWAKLWTIRVGPEPYRPLEIWNGGLVMARGSKKHLMWCDLSNFPLIIQNLPVFPSCLHKRISFVVAFEKTHASLVSTGSH